MKLRLDRFTLIVLAVVVLLLIAAIVTVNLGVRGGRESYRTDNTPQTPVYNAFLALQQGDIPTARAQYSKEVLQEVDGARGYGPLRGESYGYGESARRLRFLETTSDLQDPDRAFVNIAVDTYSGGGLFESGATWTYQRSVEVIREDGTWKINTMEYFY